MYILLEVNLHYRDHYGTLLIQSPMDRKKLAVFKGDRINEGFYMKEIYGLFARQPNKVAVITR